MAASDPKQAAYSLYIYLMRYIVFLCAALAGCASMTESECRTADWYKLGYRDADPYGLRPEIDLYAEQCKAWVKLPKVTTCADGWTATANGTRGCRGNRRAHSDSRNLTVPRYARGSLGRLQASRHTSRSVDLESDFEACYLALEPASNVGYRPIAVIRSFER